MKARWNDDGTYVWLEVERRTGWDVVASIRPQGKRPVTYPCYQVGGGDLIMRCRTLDEAKAELLNWAKENYEVTEVVTC